MYHDILRKALKRQYQIIKIDDKNFTISKKGARKLPKPMTAIFEVHLTVTETENGDITVGYERWKSDRIFATFKDDKVNVSAGNKEDKSINLADPKSFKQIKDAVEAIFAAMECTSGK